LAQIQVTPSFLRLQAITPGVQQVGHANVSGPVIAGQFQGGGGAVTGVDAARLGGQSASSYGLLAGSNTWPGVNHFTNGSSSYAGSGTLLTGLNASNMASGTVPDGRLTVGGDLTGPLSNATVSKLNGKPLSLANLFLNSVIKFDGASWVPGEDEVTLPYSGSITNNSSAFSLSNNGTGRALLTFATGGGNSIVAVAGNQVSTQGNGNGLYAYSMVSGGFGIYADSDSPAAGAGHFSSGTREVELATSAGAIRTNGFLWREYETDNFSVAVPIAYGTIGSTGTIMGGTGNFSVFHPGTGLFDVTVNGEFYSNNSYVVTITPVSNSDRHACVADGGAAFRVNMFNQAGTLVDNTFQFTVWARFPATSG